MDKSVKFPMETLSPVEAEMTMEINFARTLELIYDREPDNYKI
jgi:hypothetical protein